MPEDTTPQTLSGPTADNQIPNTPAQVTPPGQDRVIQPSASLAQELQSPQSSVVAPQPVYARPDQAPQIMPASQLAQSASPRKPRKRRWFKILLIIVACLAVIIGLLAATGHFNVKQAADSLQNPAPGQPYVSSAYGFKITQPTGWGRLQKPPEGNIVGFQFHTPDNDGGNNFYPTISIIGTKLTTQSTQSATLDQYVAANLADLAKTYQNYQLISSTPETISGTPATLVVFSSTINQSNATSAILFVIHDQTLFAVSGLTLSSAWPAHRDAIINSLLSFQF